jgi:hypothetical protein
MFNVGEYFEALRGLLQHVAGEVEAEIKQVERGLAEARRGGACRGLSLLLFVARRAVTRFYVCERGF